MAYKTCDNCKQPMISGGSVCGRASCSPEDLDLLLDAPRHGENSKRETHLDIAKFADVMEAPAEKCFDFYAVHPSSWPILHMAVDTLRGIKSIQYHKPTRTIGWESHYFGPNHKQRKEEQAWEAQRSL